MNQREVIRPGHTAFTRTSGASALRRAEVMAIGDNFNDVEMLEFAGRPVVMGNAVEALRTRGWAETARHDEAGVAAAIRRFVLDAD